MKNKEFFARNRNVGFVSFVALTIECLIEEWNEKYGTVKK